VFRIHNHDYDPSCRERTRGDFSLVGECMEERATHYWTNSENLLETAHSRCDIISDSEVMCADWEGVTCPACLEHLPLFEVLPAPPDPDDFDSVDKPIHYNSHPSGVECIEITKHMNYCLGNVIKYVWRAGLKGEAIEDLEKAATYLQYEIDRLKSI